MTARDPDGDRRGALGGLSPGGLRALRWPVIVMLAVLWNSLMLLAFRLNGSWGLHDDPRAMAVAGVACLALGCFCLAISGSERFRRLVTAPSRRYIYDAGPFALIGIVTLLLGMTAVGSAVRIAGLS